ncbi:MAG: hypothetical protein EA339_12775 [Rhodobacteraceae bacterium]|nr:MAG: hypothetical protein EA339_12775 [Paracoccaceae bacterium]
MIRLCIIGNSHVAALKHGAERLRRRHPDLQLGFFAARSNKTGGLAVVDGVYRPTSDALADQLALTSGGVRVIDPTQWDAYLVYGFGGRPQPGDFAQGLSRNFRRELYAQRIARSLLPQHLAALREITQAPVFAALAPLLAQIPKARRNRLLHHDEEAALVQSRFCDPHRAKLIAQPEATRLKDLYTIPKFNARSVPLENAHADQRSRHQEHDVQHMNARYGLVWLEHFLPVLQANLPPTQQLQRAEPAPRLLLRRALGLREQTG